MIAGICIGFAIGFGAGLVMVRMTFKAWQRTEWRYVAQLNRAHDFIKRQNALWGEWHV